MKENNDIKKFISGHYNKVDSLLYFIFLFIAYKSSFNALKLYASHLSGTPLFVISLVFGFFQSVMLALFYQFVWKKIFEIGKIQKSIIGKTIIIKKKWKDFFCGVDFLCLFFSAILATVFVFLVSSMSLQLETQVSILLKSWIIQAVLLTYVRYIAKNNRKTSGVEH